MSWRLVIGITSHILTDEQAAMYKQAVADKLSSIELGGNLYSTSFQELVSLEEIERNKLLQQGYSYCGTCGSYNHKSWFDEGYIICGYGNFYSMFLHDDTADGLKTCQKNTLEQSVAEWKKRREFRLSDGNRDARNGQLLFPSLEKRLAAFNKNKKLLASGVKQLPESIGETEKTDLSLTCTQIYEDEIMQAIKEHARKKQVKSLSYACIRIEDLCHIESPEQLNHELKMYQKAFTRVDFMQLFEFAKLEREKYHKLKAKEIKKLDTSF
jgi:hypothetical protein